MGRDDFVLSVQVLQEFYHQVTRPTRPHALTHAQAMGFIRIIDAFPVQELTFDLFLAAVSITRRFRLSYWDGAILAAARACDCDIVYSEDVTAHPPVSGFEVFVTVGERCGMWLSGMVCGWGSVMVTGG